jgi:ribosomal protein S17E
MEITTRDIRIAFYELGRILEKLNNTVLLINEKYGENQGKLFEAGFWDRLKTGAGKVGSAIGGAAGSVKNIGTTAVDRTKQAVSTAIDKTKQVATSAYDKGKQLGQQAVTAIGEIANKVAGYFSQAFQWISEQPEAFWNKVKEGWDNVADQIAKMKETAGDKFQLNVGLILEDINKKLCKKLRELTNDKQMGAYAIARKRPSDFKGKYAKFKGTFQAVGQELVKSKYAAAKEFGQKLLDSLEQGAEDVFYFTLGLILVPFYAVGWVAKKLMVLGIDFGHVVEEFIKTAKVELPEVWSEFKGGVKTGYQEKTEPATVPTTEPAAPVTPAPATERTILRFADFVNEKKKLKKKDREKGKICDDCKKFPCECPTE